VTSTAIVVCGLRLRAPGRSAPACSRRTHSFGGPLQPGCGSADDRGQNDVRSERALLPWADSSTPKPECSNPRRVSCSAEKASLLY
jgi:hypothetical protein